MKKIIWLVIIVNSLLVATGLPFSKIFKQIDGKDINKIKKLSAKIRDSANLSDKLIKSSSLTRKVSTICIEKPNYCALSKGIAIFSQKSNFARELITRTKYPMDVIRLDLKYGDKFVETLSDLSSNILEKSGKGIKSLKTNFPQMPKISFETREAIQDKMLLTLRYTGKKGWETSQSLLKLAKEHPKKSLVVGLMAWYVADPESFFENKEKALAFVGSTLKEGTKDISNLVLDSSSGIADSLSSAVKEKLTFSNGLLLLLLMVSVLVWKMRSFFKSLFTIKLNNILDKEKKKNKIKNSKEEEGLF